jgi:Smr domain
VSVPAGRPPPGPAAGPRAIIGAVASDPVDGDPFGEPVELPLDGTLDLHAFAPAEVGSLLPTWLEASHAAGLRVLRIVHGKGTGALRRRVEVLLARHPLVAGFRPADEAAGGWGATLVTLRDAPVGAGGEPGRRPGSGPGGLSG